MALVQAGYPADMVYEEDVLEDLIGQYEVLFLFDVRQLPEEVVARLARHVRRGKVVCVDSETKVHIPGATPLGASPAEVRKDPQATGLGVFVLTDRTVSPAYERLLARLEQVCAAHGLDRPVATDSRAVVPFGLHSDSGHYVVLVNVEDDRPHRVTVRLNPDPRLRVIFDLCSGEQIPCERDQGGLRFQTEISPGNGRYLVALPDAPARVMISLGRPRYQRGESVRLTLALHGQTGAPIAAALPLRISVCDPRGDERPEYGGYRATEQGVCVERFTLAANDPEGTWVVHAEDLLTGQRAQASFVVGARPANQAGLERERPLATVSLAAEIRVPGPTTNGRLTAGLQTAIQRILNDEKASTVTFDLAEKIADAVQASLGGQEGEELLVIPFRVRAGRERSYLLVFNPRSYLPNSDSVFLPLNGQTADLWDVFLGERAAVDTQGQATVFAPVVEPGQARIFELVCSQARECRSGL
jgi:hypothetical protein